MNRPTHCAFGVLKQALLMLWGYFNDVMNVTMTFSKLLGPVFERKFLPANFDMKNEMISTKWFEVIDLRPPLPRPPLPKFVRLKYDRFDWITSMTLAVFSAACRRYCSLLDVWPVNGVRLPGDRLDWPRGVRRLVTLDERRKPPYVWRRSVNSDKFDWEPLRWRWCRPSSVYVVKRDVLGREKWIGEMDFVQKNWFSRNGYTNGI